MEATEHFTKFKAKVEARRIKALTLAVDLVSKPSEEGIEATRKAVASYLGSENHLAKGFQPDGTPIPPEPSPTYRGPLFLRTVKQDPGFVVKAVHWVRDEMIVVFQSEVCITPKEAKKQVMAWAIENNRRLLLPKWVYYEGDIEYQADLGASNNLRNVAMSAVTSLVIAGSRLKADDDQITVLLNEALKPLAEYREHKVQFDRRWNANGKWIGPVRKEKKHSQKSTEVESVEWVAKSEQSAVEI